MKRYNPIYLFMLLLCCFLLKANAQFLPRFTQYREYVGLINPAALHYDYLANNGFYKFSIGLSHRSEGFSNLQETPQTQVLRFTWIPSSGNRFRLLLGGYVLKDQFGPTGFTGAFLRLGAFTYASEEFGVLSVGFNAGITQFRLKASETILLAPNDPLQNQTIQQTYPNLGAGIFYSKRLGGRHDWYIGWAMSQLFDLQLAPDADNPITDFEYKTEVNPHYYGLLGAMLYVSDYAFWEPSLWVKILPNQKTHADFNLRYQLRQPLWLGVGVSTQQTLHTEFGFHLWDKTRNGNQWKKTRKTFLKIGIGYDTSFSKLPSNLDQSLELNISLFFPEK